MSESLPPLDWSPNKAEPSSTDVEGYRWPVPPGGAYPEPQPQRQPLPVELVSANGSRSVGQLLSFNPAQRLVQLLLPPGKNPTAVRLNQLAALKLIRPIQPLPSEGRAPQPRQDYELRLRNGQLLKGSCLAMLENELGRFLFVPMSPADDTVQLLFVPQEALAGDASPEPQLIAGDAPAPRARGAGELLPSSQASTPEELLRAIEHQSRMPIVRIGEALMALGHISQAQLDEALAQQQQDRSVPLGELLVRGKVVTRAQLQSALARKMGYPVVDVDRFEPEVEALRRLPVAVAKRLEVMPLLLRGSRLIVAMEDPTRRKAIDEVEFATQLKVVPTLAQVGLVALALNGAYARIGATEAAANPDAIAPISLDFEPVASDKLVETLERDVSERDSLDDRPIEQSDNSLVRLINTMIIEAHAQGVSDIHVECQPGRDKVRVRFRKDGRLSNYLELPPSYRNALVARIKVMCDLDISERRKPQDGKINFAKFSPQHRLELRVATIPTNNGLEDVVMRLLTSAKPVPMERLALSKQNFERLEAAVQRPYGLVLCVGPTGSGKTTTLHSLLGKINTAERKIWTAEDPVEITQAGLRQVQVNPKIDWTFAKALRAFLRADPDVIMVGEIRDGETAEIAIEASLTGHLVLTTLHTNSAAETVTRLLDMGADPFNFGDSLLAVLAQRLVRRLCTECRAEDEMPEAEREELLDDYLHSLPESLRPERAALLADWEREGPMKRYRSPGCPKCDGSGYKGRVGIHELLSISRELRRLIQTGARAEDILQQGLREGMNTLRQDGIDKVRAGLTTLAEVRATSNA